MEIDHVIPLARGGATTFENLCLACSGCNAHKRDFQHGIDSESGAEMTLYNPRLQMWNDHFQWDDHSTQLVGLTAVGRATISRLRINRFKAVLARNRWVAAGLHPPIVGS